MFSRKNRLILGLITVGIGVGVVALGGSLVASAYIRVNK